MSRLKTVAIALLLAPASLCAQYAAGREVQFTVRVENVSTAQTLRLSNGTTAPAPTAPLLWTVTDGGNPLFAAGRKDRGQGLEQLAEDGNPGVLLDYIKNSMHSVAYSGIVTTPVGDKSAGPILPGKVYEFTFPAAPGQRLTMAMMFGQSNDLFYAPGANAIALFDKAGKPLTVDATRSFMLWDAGTEVNEEAGLGPNQAPRQPAPNTGPSENGVVRLVHDRWQYPAVTSVIRVSIAPTPVPTATK